MTPEPLLPDAPPSRFAGLGRLLRFALKELRETLRDRRTVATLVLMPLLLYPLLAIAFRQFFAFSEPTAPQMKYRLGIGSKEEADKLEALLNTGRQTLSSQFVVFESRRPITDLQLGDVHVSVTVLQVKGEDDRPPVTEYALLTLDKSAAGKEALRRLVDCFNAANLNILRARLAAKTRQEEPLPLTVSTATIADPVVKQSNLLASLIPLILILMTITGAVYPAIDLTAGERERGTLEVLMAAPIPRLGLLLAKYFAVLAVALLTALINLTMMTATVLVNGLGPLLFGDQGLTIVFIAEVLGVLLLFAMFFSAVLLAVTSFARSFKEAQAYLIPLMLASITPGMMTLLPGLKLNSVLSVTPLINVSLLARDLFEGGVSFPVAALVIASTLLYAVVAISVAASIFGAEAVLYNDQQSWAEVFRRPRKPRDTPTLQSALLCLALLFPAFFLVTGSLAWIPLSLDVRLVAMMLANVALFAGFPLLAAWRGRVRLTTGLSLRGAAWPTYPAAVLLGLSLWPFMVQFTLWVGSRGVIALPPQQRKQVEDMLLGWQQIGLPLILLVVAVVPAFVEELFFRGYLFNALRSAARPRTTVIVSAVLFGLFHLIVVDSLAWGRLLPTTLLGLLLGWVRLRTGSLWPCMLLHACHNSAVVTVASKARVFEPLRVLSRPAAHVPLEWLLAAGAGVILSVALLWWATRTTASKTVVSPVPHPPTPAPSEGEGEKAGSLLR